MLIKIIYFKISREGTYANFLKGISFYVDRRMVIKVKQTSINLCRFHEFLFKFYFKLSASAYKFKLNVEKSKV